MINDAQSTKILIPFLKAGIKVLNELTSLTFQKKNVYTFTGNKSIGEVKIEIPVIGDIETRVVFDMSRTFAFKLAKMMMGDLDGEDEDVEMLQAAILEVGNMIAGNAMGFLEESNIDCDIKPPIAHIGKDAQVFDDSAQLGVIEFDSQMGLFNIYIVMKELKVEEPAHLLLFNVPDVLRDFLINFFIPKGFAVFSTNDYDVALKIIKTYPIKLLFFNQMPRYQTDLNIQLKTFRELRPNVKIVFLSSSKEWDASVLSDFKGTALGYIPRAFDNLKTAKALIMIFNKIGVLFTQKRKHVQVEMNDHTQALLYLDPHGEQIVSGDLMSLSVSEASVELENLRDLEFLKEKQIIPLCQLKLKGNMTRIRAQIKSITGNKVVLHFIKMGDEDLQKVSFFIHQRLDASI